MTEEIAKMWADILGGEVHRVPYEGVYSVGFLDAVTHQIDPATLLDSPRKCFEFALGEQLAAHLHTIRQALGMGP